MALRITLRDLSPGHLSVFARVRGKEQKKEVEPTRTQDRENRPGLLLASNRRWHKRILRISKGEQYLPGYQHDEPILLPVIDRKPFPATINELRTLVKWPGY
jgi:hypothetical protein